METYLDLVLLRFGLIAAGLVALALTLFAAALALKRRGRLDQARRYADPALRAAARALKRRLEGGRR
ncbi:hypothetical protein [Streptomyces boncukensis]|uniref:Uncharacterized protein n=1 Tax=Streptomyces boncukensis TaxID=2711219 RepID=A0A6G4X4V1_9ACTN|nr:hypothetical protein [Streptomyces boncukensis]NGO71764.1 hypothetical protein [Streptomyces boncukensis]